MKNFSGRGLPADPKRLRIQSVYVYICAFARRHYSSAYIKKNVVFWGKSFTTLHASSGTEICMLMYYVRSVALVYLTTLHATLGGKIYVLIRCIRSVELTYPIIVVRICLYILVYAVGMEVLTSLLHVCIYV